MVIAQLCMLYVVDVIRYDTANEMLFFVDLFLLFSIYSCCYIIMVLLHLISIIVLYKIIIHIIYMDVYNIFTDPILNINNKNTSFCCFRFACRFITGMIKIRDLNLPGVILATSSVSGLILEKG